MSLHPVARLAIPAFFTLITEPLFLLTDSAIVGHLGTDSLAALGAASAILLTATGICVFLAYATTAVVSRQVGAGDTDAAIAAGLDGVWLAVAIGVPLAAFLAVFAHPASLAMGGSEVAGPASTYLRVSAIGVPAMLISLAVQGLLRGLQDTRTPLWVSTAGFGLNAALNATLVLGAGMGLAGSALGTVIAQWLMAVVMLIVALRRARHLDLRPHLGRVVDAARGGVPLLIRTVALRAVLLLTTALAGSFGTVTLAAHQVTSTIFTFLTFALDAIAIAAQALTGESLGRGDLEATKRTSAEIARWGVGSGVVAGVLTLLACPWAPILFSADGEVRHATTAALVVVALVQPAAGLLFVLDGVLMGAGDGVFLARTQVILLAAYTPIALGLHLGAPTLRTAGPTACVVVLWLAYSAYLVARCGLLERRRRGTAWMQVDLPGAKSVARS